MASKFDVKLWIGAVALFVTLTGAIAYMSIQINNIGILMDSGQKTDERIAEVRASFIARAQIDKLHDAQITRIQQEMDRYHR